MPEHVSGIYRYRWLLPPIADSHFLAYQFCEFLKTSDNTVQETMTAQKLALRTLTTVPLILMPLAFARIAQGHRDPTTATVILVDGIPFVASAMWWVERSKKRFEPFFLNNPQKFRFIVFSLTFITIVLLKFYANSHSKG